MNIKKIISFYQHITRNVILESRAGRSSDHDENIVGWYVSIFLVLLGLLFLIGGCHIVLKIIGFTMVVGFGIFANRGIYHFCMVIKELAIWTKYKMIDVKKEYEKYDND